MKKELKSYVSFTRAERAGLIGISLLLLLLIAVRATMYLWVHPAGDPEKDKQIIAAWKNFKQNNWESDSSSDLPKKNYEDAFDDNTSPLPDIIDINSADSATLIRLKGIGPVTAGKIIARRKQHYFTNVDQLLEVCRMPKSTFALIKVHLAVNIPAKH